MPADSPGAGECAGDTEGSRHYRDSRTALHSTWPTVIMTTRSAGQPGPGSPQTAPRSRQSASVADPPLHRRTVILPHAAAGLAQGKKTALLPARTSGRQGSQAAAERARKTRSPQRPTSDCWPGVTKPVVRGGVEPPTFRWSENKTSAGRAAAPGGASASPGSWRRGQLAAVSSPVAGSMASMVTL